MRLINELNCFEEGLCLNLFLSSDWSNEPNCGSPITPTWPCWISGRTPLDVNQPKISPGSWISTHSVKTDLDKVHYMSSCLWVTLDCFFSVLGKQFAFWKMPAQVSHLFFFFFFASSVVIHRLYRWKRPINSPSTPCQHRTVLQQTFVMVLFILVSHAPNNKVSATSPGIAASQVHIADLQEGFSSFSSAPIFPLHTCLPVLHSNINLSWGFSLDFSHHYSPPCSMAQRAFKVVYAARVAPKPPPMSPPLHE